MFRLNSKSAKILKNNQFRHITIAIFFTILSGRQKVCPNKKNLDRDKRIMKNKYIHKGASNAQGVHGALCNPSYWDSII